MYYTPVSTCVTHETPLSFSRRLRPILLALAISAAFLAHTNPQLFADYISDPASVSEKREFSARRRRLHPKPRHSRRRRRPSKAFGPFGPVSDEPPFLSFLTLVTYNVHGDAAGQVAWRSDVELGLCLWYRRSGVCRRA